jgi:parvulin-like peptidyl-prolyl isomerase
MVVSRSIWLVLAAAGSTWGIPEHASAAPVEPSRVAEAAVVARVNGEPVTEAELKRLLSAPAERQRLVKELGVEDPEDAALERLAMSELVHRRLILQEARRRGFTASERELDKEIASLRSRFGDLGSMGVWMKEQGLDDHSLFDAIRDELLAARVRGALVEKVRLGEEQVQQYRAEHEEDLKTEEVWLQIIAVKERATAERILAALRKGEDFGALARQHSVGLRARQHGDMGWVDANTLGPPLREAVRALQTGEARGPLVRGDVLLIVRLEARRSAAMSPVAARFEIERRLLPAAQRQAVQSWLSEQEAKADIETLPRERVAEVSGR